MLKNYWQLKELRTAAERLEELDADSWHEAGSEADKPVESFLKARIAHLLRQHFGGAEGAPIQKFEEYPIKSLLEIVDIALENGTVEQALVESSTRKDGDLALDAIVQASIWRGGTFRFALVGLGFAYSVALALLGFGVWSTNDAANAARDLVTAAEANLEGARASLNQADALKSGVDDKIQMFDVRFQETGSRIDDVDRQVDSISARASERLRNLDAAITRDRISLNKNIENAKKEFASVPTLIEEIAVTQANKIVDVSGDLSDKISNALTGFDETNTRLTELQEDVGSLEQIGSNIEELDVSLSANLDKVSELEARLAKLPVEMVGELDRLETEISMLLSETQPARELANRLTDRSGELADAVIASMSLTNENLKRRWEFLLFTNQWLLLFAVSFPILILAIIWFLLRLNRKVKALSPESV